TVTDGAEIDYRVILEDAKRDNQQTPVEQSPIDPHGATNLSHQQADEKGLLHRAGQLGFVQQEFADYHAWHLQVLLGNQFPHH
uniref:hypothetical protein n=1 Tax=Klebsiella pneumoniae TaxID=573 RepID=UPI001F5EA923